MMRHKAPLIVAVFLALLLPHPVSAKGSAPKQVLLESKFVEVSRVTEQMIYEAQKGRDVTSEIGLLVTTNPDNSKTVNASIVSYGGGADFRRIETRNPLLVLYPQIDENGGIKTILRPELVETIQIQKSSVAAPAAPFLFGAFGAMYEGPGRAAASNPGQVCPVTGKPLDGQAKGSTGVHNVIDKAGMAAGMALLTSQAKGELDGLKVKWQIEPKLSYKFDLKYETFNTNNKKTENLVKTFTFPGQAATPGKPAETGYREYTFQNIGDFKEFKLQTDVNVKVEGAVTKIDVISDVTGKDGTSNWEPRTVKIVVGDETKYEHKWDDFDHSGHCLNCDAYEPFADDNNYDDDGYYLGPPFSHKLLNALETSLEIVNNNSTLKSIFEANVPVIRTLFTTEIQNKKTQQLITIQRPVILDDPL